MPALNALGFLATREFVRSSKLSIPNQTSLGKGLIMANSNAHSSHAASGGKTRRTRRTGRRDPLAVSLLKKDHRQVEEWFDEYEQLEETGEKKALFQQIALALKVHTKIEEEIFYP